MRRFLVRVVAALTVVVASLAVGPAGAHAEDEPVPTEAPSTEAPAPADTVAPLDAVAVDPVAATTTVPSSAGAADTAAAAGTTAAADPAVPTTAAGARVVDDPNGCTAVVWDPTSRLIDAARIATAAASLGSTGAEVHVRIETSTDGGVGIPALIAVNYALTGDGRPFGEWYAAQSAKNRSDDHRSSWGSTSRSSSSSHSSPSHSSGSPHSSGSSSPSGGGSSGGGSSSW